MFLFGDIIKNRCDLDITCRPTISPNGIKGNLKCENLNI